MTDQIEDMPWEEDDGMSDYQERAIQAEEESKERAENGIPESLSDSVYGERDLVKRARKLVAAQLIDWPHMKRVGDGMEVPNPRSDANRFTFLEAIFDNCSGKVPHPYFDLFSAQALDHEGNLITERSSHAAIMTRAMDAAGLKMQGFNQVDESYRRLANSVTRNSLLDHFNRKCVEFDGASRLDDWLIKFFRLKNSELNRRVSRYFWLSVYNRVTNPGSHAPISIALIGAQDVGKSYFSVRLCRALMGMENAAPTALNLSDIERNLNDWLRRITGHSVIANIGELRGYKKTDIETFKEFTTRTVDNLNQKWGSPIDVPRQWVIIADANSYDGFNRDETGNRRFYPFFVNQGEDVDGQPWWPTSEEDPWRADFEGFDEAVWNIMAECRFEMQRMGQKGYVEFVGEVTREIAAFSHSELQAGRGTIKDETMESAARELIMGVTMAKVEGNKHKGFFIRNPDILAGWNRTQRGSINNASMTRTMRTLGWAKANVSGLGRGWIFNVSADVIDDVDEKTIRYLAFCGERKISSKMKNIVNSDKLFNAAVRRAIKRVSPDAEGF